MDDQWRPDDEDWSWEGVWQASTDQLLPCDDDDYDYIDDDDNDDDEIEQPFVTWAGSDREKEAYEREIVGRTKSLDV